MINRLILSITFLFGCLFLNAQIDISDKEFKNIIKEYSNTNKSDSSIRNIFSMFLEKEVFKEMMMLANKSDTIYIVEMCDIESSYCYGSLINKNKIINYIFHEKVTLSKHQKFSNYTLGLVKDWNICKLNELGKEKEIVSPNTVSAIRIILEKEIVVDKFNFNEYLDI